jgi:hypothetical protein
MARPGLVQMPFEKSFFSDSIASGMGADVTEHQTY